jgi:phosphatidate phosphatase APP1
MICRITAGYLLALFLAGAAIAGGDAITLYPAYGDARGTVIEGRIVESHRSWEPEADDSAFRNLLHNLRLFMNDERKHRAVDIEIGGRTWQTRTDRDGYFRLEVGADAELTPGWHEVHAHDKRAVAVGEALIVRPTAKRGLISDLDDTILVSEVTRKTHFLSNTFLKNATQRRAVPGTARLYASLAAADGETAPIFYLSASPRQLYEPITSFLERNAFPRGVLITKRVSDDRQSDPLFDLFAYKTEKIEDIFARLPGVRFVLVGDDGERDPETYDWARRNYPERVEAVWIRHVNPDPRRARYAGQRDLDEVLAENGAIPPGLTQAVAAR